MYRCQEAQGVDCAGHVSTLSQLQDYVMLEAAILKPLCILSHQFLPRFCGWRCWKRTGRQEERKRYFLPGSSIPSISHHNPSRGQLWLKVLPALGTNFQHQLHGTFLVFQCLAVGRLPLRSKHQLTLSRPILRFEHQPLRSLL